MKGIGIMARILRVKCYRILSCIFLSVLVLFIVDISGVFRHIQEKSFQTEFTYPLETPNFIDIVNKFRLGAQVDVPPINTLYSSIVIKTESVEQCSVERTLPLLILVKSAPGNLINRNAIRETWKVSTIDHNGKLLFFIGNPSLKSSDKTNFLQDLSSESRTYNDIVQLGFEDSYYNNTIKTMLEMRWAAEQCSNFSYALLVDDDYYVSIKNLMHFLENPLQYPRQENVQLKRKNNNKNRNVDKLYAGYRMFPPPHRHKIFTKWYMPLEEYPFDYFPPYITAGAILLSRNALLDIYYASFYTTHFRFDDIYVAICAKKMNITPINSEYFRFWTTRDESPEEYLIASHGFSEPKRLHRFWSVQKSYGFC